MHSVVNTRNVKASEEGTEIRKFYSPKTLVNRENKINNVLM